MLSAGRLLFHGPREEVLPFFASLGFQLPERKGAADFLQEVTSKVDQQVGRMRDYMHSTALSCRHQSVNTRNPS